MSDETPKDLTLGELIDALKTLEIEEGANCVVGIPYMPGHATIGSSPLMPVSGVFAGFDWDKGRVFLKPKERLGTPDHELIKKHKKDQDNTFRFLMDLRRVVDDKNKTSEEKLATLETLINEGPRKEPKQSARKP